MMSARDAILILVASGFSYIAGVNIGVYSYVFSYLIGMTGVFIIFALILKSTEKGGTE